MASSSSSSLPGSPAKRKDKQRRADEFIEQQLKKIRWQVKLTDLISSLMTLAAGILGYLLIVAMVDHWLFDLGPWGRSAAFGLLVLWVGWYVVTRLGPILFFGINPMYAARAIEQSTPSVKNSLINFLTFRTHRSEVNELVYRALETRAATDLTRVRLETAVDRSQVIRVGYVLAALLALGGLYVVLSPKDPFQTASRVVAPWAQIARPSRVEITEVQPADVTTFRGDSVSVVAHLQGMRPSDTVQLVYNTEDGQLVDRRVPMELEADGLRSTGTLPPGQGGVEQDLLYRVEAGDAVSRQYRVTASPAPTLVVDRVDYDFPDYTGKADRSIRGEGNIDALEGTRVTVRARANQPVGSAHLHFAPDRISGSQDRDRRRLPMEFEDQSVWQSFVLELRSDRPTPSHDSYQLEFVTEEGHESQQPVLHSIRVTPDFAPEVEVLTPKRDRTEVPLDGKQRIEVRALDPDFGLRRVSLRAVSGGSDVVQQVLFEDAQGQRGQTVVNYEFRPSQLDLAVGDEVAFWAVAEDNRQAPGGEEPEPNTQRTRQYKLLIVAPESADPQGQETAEEDGSSEDAPEADEGAQQSDEGEGNDAEEASQGDTQGDSGNAEQEERSEEASQASDGHTGEQADGETDNSSADGQSGSDQPQQGEQAGGESAQGDSAQGDSAQGESAQGESAQGESGEGDPASSEGDPSAEGDGEPLHDGEVFERALEHMKQQQDQEQQDQQEQEQQQQESPSDDQVGDQPSSDGQTGSDSDGTSSDSDAGRDNRGDAQGGAEGQEGSAPQQDPTESGDGSSEPAQGESEGQTEEGGPQHADKDRGEGTQQEGAPGEGGTSQGESAEGDRGEDAQTPEQADTPEKEPGIGEGGDSGAGQDSRDTSGSGSVESGEEPVENRDREKKQSPGTPEPQEEGESDASTSRQQSDSEGGSSGDRSGGGQKGAGQGADQPGQDSPGSNSSSDDGAGASQESGAGDASDAAGQDQTADGQTGSSGREKGDGSATEQDPEGDQTGGGAPSSQENSADSERDSGNQGEGAGDSGVPGGGGVPSDNQGGSNLDDLEVPEGDDANLEYARRATDMVLEHLEDQKERPDQKLLDDLGWTKDDLQQFLDKWQHLRDGAREDPQGERELNETLRSLGLQPSRDRVRQGGANDDQLKGLSESADDSGPPASYREQFKAFRKGSEDDD